MLFYGGVVIYRGGCATLWKLMCCFIEVVCYFIEVVCYFIEVVCYFIEVVCYFIEADALLYKGVCYFIVAGVSLTGSQQGIINHNEPINMIL